MHTSPVASIGAIRTTNTGHSRRPWNATTPQPAATAIRRERDLRLDFFRGLAMFIILVSHIHDNAWALWIPARFGFSDAADIFVFCSGIASGLAFGPIFLERGWLLGAARIAYRVWQIYWAHIGVFFATVVLVVVLDRTGVAEGLQAAWPPVAPVFTRTSEAVFGLFTLTYVPGLFDILPMYLAILAMVPLVMAVWGAWGRRAVLILIVGTWFAANLAGWGRTAADADDLNIVQLALARIGEALSCLNLPASPWKDHVWFFNPFAWQLVFFAGFAFAMGWLRPPPVTRGLVVAASAVVIVTLPFAWYKLYQPETGYLPAALGSAFIAEARDWIEPLRWKTWMGGWRFLHFLALAYLAWVIVGPGGERLRSGWQARTHPRPARIMSCVTAGAVLLVTFPYTYIAEIRAIAPGFDLWFVENMPTADPRWIGLHMLVHLAALLVFLWNAIGDRARSWLVQDAFVFTVSVVSKVGTQSLAVFIASLVLARFLGWCLEVMGAHVEAAAWTYITPHDAWLHAPVNLAGFAALITVAYTVSWFKRQPWRERRPVEACTLPQPTGGRVLAAE